MATALVLKLLEDLLAVQGSGGPEMQQVEDVLAVVTTPPGKARSRSWLRSSDRAVASLGPTRAVGGNAKTGHDLVEDQKHTVPADQFGQRR